jgi:hypothetical protein
VSDTGCTIDVLLPDLLSPPAPRLTFLERLLARSDRRRASACHEALLFSLFGHPTDKELPVAAVVLYGAHEDSDVAEGVWLCADPVQFIPARDHVLVSPTRALRTTEAATLAAELASHFQVDGWQVHHAAGRLFLRGPQAPDFSLPPTREVLGRSLDSVLPHDREHLHWLSLINELQMLLHGSALNRQREAAGAPPVNGLWLWGAGVLPEARPAPFDTVWGGGALVRGLARLGTCAMRDLPMDAGALADASGTRHLVVFPEHHDLTPALDAAWFGPLLSALRARRFQRLSVHDGQGRVFHLTPRGLRRFWRLRRPIESYRTC